ncbi:hypothetical protein K493DRAFT_310814 [Basidiobolus meristosporus CBS 931.73]|uniref:VHS-domain-containing protein n=1 Tax=Basidiobolus meristosporus CBS 931.73 TaxID=1314790 RepID=A0A1Y1Z6I8_9FUNG|nr:hypothetical protein K493DRAFT_310814 [Basidiobolus meristosporus CBS 931.73]|eukprot:ORY05869.1 hypothetical protein K493DRAFT_310814 [Basidiobolus meristosporus CBS 931.73]
MKFFGSNPVSDSIDKLVKKPDYSKDDLGQLCNLVNSRENGMKEAAKALQNKLKSRESQAVLISLSLYESLIERYGAKFYGYIISDKFLNTLQKLVTSRYSDVIVRNRVIELLQIWTVTFENDPSMSPIKSLYEKLAFQGSIPTGDNRANNSSEDIQLSTEHVEKTINSGRSYSQMLAEALAFTDPETTDVTRDDLIQEFYEKCKSSQAKIAKILALTDNEADLSSLLKVNHELINTLNLYNEMVERQLVAAATKASLTDSMKQELPDLIQHEETIGAGSGTSHSSLGSDHEQDPFADPGGSQLGNKPSDKKLGKRPDYAVFETTDDEPGLQKPLVPVSTHAII